MPAERYVGQVQLLIRTIPEIAREEMFALKGGTAINLFVRDLPRLSVDIDLVYLPVADRDTSLGAVREGLARIADQLEQKLGLTVARQLIPDGKRLIVSNEESNIKVEVSPVLRGTVFEPGLRQVTPAVEERFGFAEMNVVSMADLYAGKIAAALDRQHPRDLFDVHFLLESDGIDEDLFRAFLVYLVSHSRPADELLNPHLLDLTFQYDEEFVGMTVEEVPLPALIDARQRLIQLVQEGARREGARRFLLGFHALQPDWTAIGLDNDIGELPAVRWKMRNLERLRAENELKFSKQLETLRQVLDE